MEISTHYRSGSSCLLKMQCSTPAMGQQLRFGDMLCERVH